VTRNETARKVNTLVKTKIINKKNKLMSNNFREPIVSDQTTYADTTCKCEVITFGFGSVIIGHHQVHNLNCILIQAQN
jgi:ABC-type uncharacterized transport system permease subunit